MSILVKMGMLPFVIEGKKNLREIPDLPTFESKSVEKFAVLYAKLSREYMVAMKVGDEKTKSILLPFFSKLVQEGIEKEDVNNADKATLEFWFDEILEQ